VSAQLRLYSPNGSSGTNRLYMTACSLDTPWTEDEVTWTEPSAGVPWSGPGSAEDYGAPPGWAWMDGPGWVAIDLNPSSLLDSGNGLIIRGEGSENRQVAYWFFSREYENTDLQPQLVFEYEGP
jgi:hypothetical protein